MFPDIELFFRLRTVSSVRKTNASISINVTLNLILSREISVTRPLKHRMPCHLDE
jgi:hypothetical protein